MTKNERVRELRKELGLTLEKFGVRLGVGKTAISGIETGRRGLTDQMFLSICREYNVNPGWLETGNGPMFEDETGSLEISMSCTPEEMDRATQILELMQNSKYPEIMQILEMLMNCTPKTIEKGVQILEMLKNPKYEELFNNILQISDSQRLEALICWSNQYKDGGNDHE